MNETQLANIALGLVGVSNGITDIAERSVEAERVRLHWDLARDVLLRSKPWNFATRRATLSALSEAPAFDWAVAYALPNDYLKALELNGKAAGTGEAEFEISAGQLLCDDDEALLKYTARIEDTTQWDSSFCDAFTYALAAAIVSGLSTSSNAGANMRARAEDIANQAVGPNSVETKPRAVLAQSGSGWLRARYGL